MVLNRLSSTVTGLLGLGYVPPRASGVTDARDWRRFVEFLAIAAVGLGAMVAAVLLTLDPYDTGHFAVFGDHGVPRFGQRLTSASLGRQRGFDIAIIGNSLVQLLDPARITTSGRAVQLSIPGTGPLEQLAVAEWFRRHHPGRTLRALVIGLDSKWCRGDGKLELTNAFPFWLYADSTLSYAAGLVSLQGFDAAMPKLKLLLGRAQPARQDGYNDYEVGRVWDPAEVASRLALPENTKAPENPATPPADFAAAPLLRRFLAHLPEATRVVFVWPPRHRHALPVPGTAAAAHERACTAAFAAIATSHPGAQLIDFRGRPGMRDDEDYWDLNHYRAPVARKMEAAIAAALSPAH